VVSSGLGNRILNSLFPEQAKAPPGVNFLHQVLGRSSVDPRPPDSARGGRVWGRMT
jgi:hypothetical protein